jgi:hypothetical protein
MGFSFASLGFGRLALATLIFEILHGILESHWLGIQGSRIGPRPRSAVLFMSLEAIVLVVTVTAGISTISRLLKLAVRPVGQMSAIILAVLGLLVLFVFVWQR